MERKTFENRAGFSLMEVLVYVAIFAVSATFLVSILTTVMGIQGKQTSANEVNQQSTFVGNTIQRLVQDSSLIEMPSGFATGTIKLRMASSTLDPTLIYGSGTVMYLAQGTSTPETLTDSSVSIDNFSAKKIDNAGGMSIVDVSLSMSYNTSSTKQKTTRTLQFAISRIRAATFDSDVLPSASSYNLGQQSATTWQKILVGDGSATGPSHSFGNDTNTGFYRVGADIMSFVSAGTDRLRIDASGNVGIGNTSPSVRLDVTGEVKFSGISGDGNGKVACIKSDGALGTCTTSVGAGGTCTCS